MMVGRMNNAATVEVWVETRIRVTLSSGEASWRLELAMCPLVSRQRSRCSWNMKGKRRNKRKQKEYAWQYCCLHHWSKGLSFPILSRPPPHPFQGKAIMEKKRGREVLAVAIRIGWYCSLTSCYRFKQSEIRGEAAVGRGIEGQPTETNSKAKLEEKFYRCIFSAIPSFLVYIYILLADLYTSMTFDFEDDEIQFELDEDGTWLLGRLDPLPTFLAVVRNLFESFRIY